MLGFIIFGWPEKEKTIGEVAPGACPNCQNQSFWYLNKTRRWVTFFWIPILPLSRKTHYLVCDICGLGVEIEGEEVTDTKQLIETTEQFKKFEIEELEYVTAVNDYWAEIRTEPVEEETETEPEKIRGIQ